MAQSSARTAIGNVFGLVTTITGAVSTTVETGVGGIEMLDRFVKKQARKQVRSDIAEMGSWESKMLDRMALEDQQHGLEIAAYRGTEGSVEAQLFDTARAQLQALMDAADNAGKRAKPFVVAAE